MIYLVDSQNNWDFSKPSELCGPELGAGAWAARWPLLLLLVTGSCSALGRGAHLWASPFPKCCWGGSVST